MTNPGEIQQIDKSLGRAIREARLQAGLSLDDLGKRIGRSATMVQRYESGLLAVSAGTAFIIAIELGCDISDFLKDSLGRDLDPMATSDEKNARTHDVLDLHLARKTASGSGMDQPPPPHAA